MRAYRFSPLVRRRTATQARRTAAGTGMDSRPRHGSWAARPPAAKTRRGRERISWGDDLQDDAGGHASGTVPAMDAWRPAPSSPPLAPLLVAPPSGHWVPNRAMVDDGYQTTKEKGVEMLDEATVEEFAAAWGGWTASGSGGDLVTFFFF